MTSVARRISSWVLRAFKTRETHAMLTLYKSLVRSKLEYCCPLWDAPQISDMIEAVQRKLKNWNERDQLLGKAQKVKLALQAAEKRKLLHYHDVENGQWRSPKQYTVKPRFTGLLGGWDKRLVNRGAGKSG